MVLWEITLGTAYFLGLRRTYRLALKIQRRVIGPKHPKARQFAQTRTRAIFDIALRVHRNIQERDIEVGRSLGNWILRWLDRMKPAAQIRGGKPPSSGNSSSSMTKKFDNSSHQKTPGGFQSSNGKSGDRDSERHLFYSSRNIWHKPFPTIPMMMRPSRPAGSNIQYRNLFTSGPDAFNHGRFGSSGVIRKDIMQWMLQR
ncbi:hypothetical protein RJ640_017797 [Escallonia rubra]|uniref:Uncharacterized protein n=1 Tax=Escallonia rubra TaxID=112253 RepID=A0AA88URT7_9ASTE|nr:hypothetical protein RJ640_017797 [Escallonia rubra]